MYLVRPWIRLRDCAAPLDRMLTLSDTGAEYVLIAELAQAATPVEITFELVRTTG